MKQSVLNPSTKKSEHGITSKKQHKVKAGSAQVPTLGRVKIKPSVLKKKF
jgi:hypothetical protein